MRLLFLVAFQLFIITKYIHADPICENWFKKHFDSKKNKDCISDCVVFSTGMATFHCTSQCAKLCNSSAVKRYTFTVSKHYSLNNAESALVAERPKESFRAYTLSWQAEKTCADLYFNSQTNDESDACRHYVWASLLTENFGRELAEKYLYAHESEPTQPIEEKAMDIANNNRGISRAEKRIKESTFSKDIIISDFLEDIDSGKIIILKKRTPLKEQSK